MAHSSGIPLAPELDEAFGQARQSNATRFLKIEIIDDTLVQTGSHPLTDNFESDFGAILSHFNGKEPCYIVFRLDTRTDVGFQWMLCSYVPDGSPVRQRMLYGSTRELLKRHLGTSFFASDMHGSSAEDFSYDAYLQLKSKHIDSPLTEAELVTKSEASMEVDYGHTREYVHSVAFPMAVAAINALKSLPIGSNNLVQLSVDTEKETVELRGHKNISVEELANEIPTEEPCFNFFRYDHTHNKLDLQQIVFIYSCPSGSKIKQRMLYSTVKAAATGAAEDVGVKIAKKLEVNDPSDVCEDYLLEELHPPTPEMVTQPAIKRPQRAGRGRPRMIRK